MRWGEWGRGRVRGAGGWKRQAAAAVAARRRACVRRWRRSCVRRASSCAASRAGRPARRAASRALPFLWVSALVLYCTVRVKRWYILVAHCYASVRSCDARALTLPTKSWAPNPLCEPFISRCFTLKLVFLNVKYWLEYVYALCWCTVVYPGNHQKVMLFTRSAVEWGEARVCPHGQDNSWLEFQHFRIARLPFEMHQIESSLRKFRYYNCMICYFGYTVFGFRFLKDKYSI